MAMDIAAYLERIGYNGDTAPTEETLRQLQFAHLCSVPYENLDILGGIALSLDEDALFDKIVLRKRGGYCFELNELFGRLLRAMGYEVVDYFARFLWQESTIPKRRHHVLGVSVPGAGERWVCDVGVGVGSPNYPLKMAYGLEQWQDDNLYRLDMDAFLGWVVMINKNGSWKPIYSFTEEPQLPHDYLCTSFFCEHSLESPFNKQAMIAMRTADGRRTLDGSTFKIFSGADVRTWEEPTEKAHAETLKAMFGIVV